MIRPVGRLADPVHIGMRAGEHLVAAWALAARIESLFRPPLAKHPLCQPQCKQPLADAWRTNKQERAGQAAAGQGMAEAGENIGVAAEHGESGVGVRRVQGSGFRNRVAAAITSAWMASMGWSALMIAI